MFPPHPVQHGAHVVNVPSLDLRGVLDWQPGRAVAARWAGAGACINGVIRFECFPDVFPECVSS